MGLQERLRAAHDNEQRHERRTRIDYPIAIDSRLGAGDPPTQRLQRRLRRRGHLSLLDKALSFLYWTWEAEPHLALAWLIVPTGRYIYCMAPASRTPQHERRARTRAALLRAAGRVFAEHGFHRATLEAVAAEAGVSKGALFHYFPSKEQLFLALLEDRLGAGVSDVEAVIAERGTDSGQLGAATETFLRRINRDPHWLPLLLEFLAYGSREPAAKAEITEHFLRPARQAVASTARRLGIPESERALLSPEELGLAIAALVNGLAIERAFDPGAVPNDLLARLFIVWRAGLSATANTATASKPTSKPTTRTPR